MNQWGGSEYWKGLFINRLIADMGFDSYLELGIGAGNTWNLVNCKRKVGVDTIIQKDGVINCTTDEYFANHKEKFDVIYVDAYHEKNQVFRDYLSSLDCLTDRGILMFHDVNPPNESSTSQSGCGDAYVFWVTMCLNTRKAYTMTEVVGGGCPGEDSLGMVLKKDQKYPLQNLCEFRYSQFNTNRSEFIYDRHVTFDQLKELLK